MNEKLNALSRLSLLVSIAMFALDYSFWLSFLLLALLIIVVLKYVGQGKTESFSITPTYTSNDFQQVTVAPMFAEEWQIKPPSYDLVEAEAAKIDFMEPKNPQSYPYGQYLTRTNLLPADEHYTRLGCGLRSAREYANSAFLRHDLAFRDNMTRVFKKKLERIRRHNCNDTFSPYNSY